MLIRKGLQGRFRRPFWHTLIIGVKASVFVDRVAPVLVLQMRYLRASKPPSNRPGIVSFLCASSSAPI